MKRIIAAAALAAALITGAAGTANAAVPSHFTPAQFGHVHAAGCVYYGVPGHGTYICYPSTVAK